MADLRSLVQNAASGASGTAAPSVTTVSGSSLKTNAKSGADLRSLVQNAASGASGASGTAAPSVTTVSGSSLKTNAKSGMIK